MIKKHFLLFLTAIVLTLTAIQPPIQAETVNLNETANFTRLLTSNCKDSYAVISVSGNDKIKISGVYENDVPIDIGVVGSQSSSTDIHAENGGAFTAELTSTPLENGYFDLYIRFQSRLYFRYVLKYNNGWYIPDNGIAAANEEKLNNITEAAPLAAAYYLSANADRQEITDTMNILQGIVEQVCTDEQNDYEKAYALIQWIGENIYYDHDAAETSVTMDTVAVHNVLERRRTTCAGFANTYSALLELVGIRSVNLKGAAVAGEITYPELPTGTENHEFCAFWYEDEQRWVYTDPCWTSNCNYRNGEYKSEITAAKRYFDETPEAFAQRHRADKAEERFYTKALAALDSEIGSTTQEEPATTSAPAQTTSEALTLTATTTPPPNSSNQNEQTSSDLTPYIIIGLTGVMVIGAGIILAVNNRKK